MNRERSKQIAAARMLIDKGKALLDEARDMLETVKDDEQAARENLPPSLEDSERAQAMDAAVSELESAISALGDFDADEIGTNLDTARSEEHTSELQSLMRISYAVFCLKKKNKHTEQEKVSHMHVHDIA